MAWNPFEDIFDGISNFVEGASSWIGNGFSGFMDMFESGAARRNEERANQQLQLSGTALQHQIAQDEWSRAFTEGQSQFQQEAFNKQYELASHPISTLIADGRSNGINPMASLGQNVGSASYSSVSAPNSSVSNPGSASAGSAQNFLPNVLSFVGSLLGTGLSSQTSKDVAHINAEANKEIADKDNETKKSIADEEIKVRKEELQEEQSYHNALKEKLRAEIQGIKNDYDIASRTLDETKRNNIAKLEEEAKRRIQDHEHFSEAERNRLKEIDANISHMQWAESHGQKELAEKYFSDVLSAIAQIGGSSAFGLLKFLLVK